MDGEVQERIMRLKHKFELVTSRYALIIKQKGELEIKIAELEAEIESLRKENLNQRKAIELLHAARAVAPTRDELERSRTILSNLVREVNKCITDLTQ